MSAGDQPAGHLVGTGTTRVLRGVKVLMKIGNSHEWAFLQKEAVVTP